MRNRVETLLRLACLVLAVLLLYQLVLRIVHRDPLAHLRIPAVPTLAAGDKSTNAPASSPGTAATNAVPGAGSKPSTNPPAKLAGANSTNLLATDAPGLTNLPAPTAALAKDSPRTNAAPSGTNAPPAGLLKDATNASAAPALVKTSSNSPAPSDLAKSPTNAARPLEGTNSGRPGARPGPMMGMGGPPRPGMGLGPPAELPLAIKARVDRIYESEILGQVMRPLPMALLGIAGETAFLRAPNGQTGLVKEGNELGGVKLLRIGVNRILVEQDGQKQELMIFNGLGGESLISK